MKFSLADGTWTHLCGIVQADDYRRPYLEPPIDAAEEIKRIARLYLPTTCWRQAPMLLIGFDPNYDLKYSAKLPPIMCIGEFVSYRTIPGEKPKEHVHIHVVWLQNEFQSYFSSENEAAFQQIEWDKYFIKRKKAPIV